MIGDDVFTEHSDYKWFRLEYFRNSRNSLCSPNKKKATAVVALWLIVYSSGIVKYLPSLSYVNFSCRQSPEATIAPLRLSLFDVVLFSPSGFAK